jgi:hypothetical protein
MFQVEVLTSVAAIALIIITIRFIDLLLAAC